MLKKKPNLNTLKETLRRHEGVEKTVYDDTRGIPTVGVGRNLRDVGLSDDEIDYLLENDIKRTMGLMDEYMGWYKTLDAVRQEALINFVFNVGIGTAMKFKRAMEYLQKKEYDAAADEFLDSRWKKQVGQRAYEITDMIRTGKRHE